MADGAQGNLRKEIAGELEWLNQNAKGQQKKGKARLRRYDDLVEQVAPPPPPPQMPGAGWSHGRCASRHWAGSGVTQFSFALVPDRTLSSDRQLHRLHCIRKRRSY